MFKTSSCSGRAKCGDAPSASASTGAGAEAAGWLILVPDQLTRHDGDIERIAGLVALVRSCSGFLRIATLMQAYRGEARLVGIDQPVGGHTRGLVGQTLGAEVGEPGARGENLDDQQGWTLQPSGAQILSPSHQDIGLEQRGWAHQVVVWAPRTSISGPAAASNSAARR